MPAEHKTKLMVLSDFNKVVHVLAILSRSTASNFSPKFLLICEHNSLKKSACYRPFKNGHSVRVRTEKMINHQNRENGERNQNQTEALISLILSKSINKTCLIDNFIEQSTKLCDSVKILAGLVS